MTLPNRRRTLGGAESVTDGHAQVADGDGMRPPSALVDLNDPKVLALARRLYWRRYSQRIEAMGIDHEDALQTVYLGLVTRSRSASRWDPNRGALSNWMFVAMRGILLNLVDHQRRVLRRSGSVGAGEDVALSVWLVEEEAGDAEVEADVGEAGCLKHDSRSNVRVDKRFTDDGRATRAGGVGQGWERMVRKQFKDLERVEVRSG